PPERAPPPRGWRQDAGRRDPQRHSGDDALDRRDPRDAPARRRIRRRARGAPSVPRRHRGAGAHRVTDSVLEAVPAGTAPDRRVLALDIDGTVLLADETLSPGTVEAVSAAIDAGHIVTIATGRSWLGTRKVVEWLGIAPELIVTANGATIMCRDESAPEGYVRDTIETFDATEVLTQLERELPEANFLVELGDGTRLYNNFVDDWDLSAPNAHHVDIEEMKGREVTRIVVVSDDHAGDEFAGFVDRMGLQQVSYAVGWSAWLDIAPQGV